MDKTTFVMTENHLKLLQRMNVGWQDCEFGAPEIDPKRPYGNSDVVQDIVEIIGCTELREGVFEFDFAGKKWLLKGEDKYNIEFVGPEDDKLYKLLEKLHKETETALQVCLSTKSFKVGKYQEKDYGDWVKVE